MNTRCLVVRNHFGKAKAVYILSPEDTWTADAGGVTVRKDGVTYVHSGKTAKEEELDYPFRR